MESVSYISPVPSRVVCRSSSLDPPYKSGSESDARIELYPFGFALDYNELAILELVTEWEGPPTQSHLRLEAAILSGCARN